MNGWIKVHRALAEHHVASDPHSLSVWLHMLMMANHREAKRQINGRVIAVQPGQLITSRKSLAEKTGVNESKVERVLKLLQSEQLIEQHGTSKFRVISIVNWAKYQLDEQHSEQQVNSKRTADEQQMNTPEEVSSDTEKDKNGENKASGASGDAKKRKTSTKKTKLPEPFMLTKEMRDWAKDDAPAVSLGRETEKFCDYWRGSAGTKADWVATWRNWMRKAQEDLQKGGGAGAGRKPFNKQAAVEENNMRVVQEIMDRETARGMAQQPPNLFDLGDPITVEGEYVRAE